MKDELSQLRRDQYLQRCCGLVQAAKTHEDLLLEAIHIIAALWGHAKDPTDKQLVQRIEDGSLFLEVLDPGMEKPDRIPLPPVMGDLTEYLTEIPNFEKGERHFRIGEAGRAALDHHMRTVCA